MEFSNLSAERDGACAANTPGLATTAAASGGALPPATARPQGPRAATTAAGGRPAHSHHPAGEPEDHKLSSISTDRGDSTSSQSGLEHMCMQMILIVLVTPSLASTLQCQVICNQFYGFGKFRWSQSCLDLELDMVVASRCTGRR